MSSKKCVGYWGTWAAYRKGDGKFEFTDIDPNLFTHLIYTFFGLTPSGEIKYLDEWLDIGRGFIQHFIELKSKNPSCKMLASVGGWNCSESIFSEMASKPESRSAFATNTLAFLKKHGFDGMDIDWEYPVQREGAVNPQDKQNFILLLEEMRKVLSPSGLLLTVAVGATQSRGETSYDIPGVARNVDFINLMTYDLHGSWDHRTGINAPLFSNDQLNVDACVKYWLSKGCPKEKLIVGVPTYGRTFTLSDTNQNGINAPASGAGAAGPWTAQQGFLGYNEIVANNWPRKWQDDQKVPYAFQGNQWVGYEDPQSAQEKANYVISNGLGGCMFWSIETDDFHKGNPIISAVSKKLNASGNHSKSCLDKVSKKAQSKLSAFKESCFPCL